MYTQYIRAAEYSRYDSCSVTVCGKHGGKLLAFAMVKWVDRSCWVFQIWQLFHCCAASCLPQQKTSMPLSWPEKRAYQLIQCLAKYVQSCDTVPLSYLMLFLIPVHKISDTVFNKSMYQWKKEACVLDLVVDVVSVVTVGSMEEILPFQRVFDCLILLS